MEEDSQLLRLEEELQQLREELQQARNHGNVSPAHSLPSEINLMLRCYVVEKIHALKFQGEKVTSENSQKVKSVVKSFIVSFNEIFLK